VYRSVIEEAVVGLVQNDDQIAFDGNLGDVLEHLVRNHTAGGVARGVQDDRLGALRAGLFDVLGARYEALILGRINENRRAARELHLLGKGNPVRSRDDDLVALFDQRLKGRVQGMLAADGDDGLGRLVLDAVGVRVMRGDRLAQLRYSGRRRVPRVAVHDRPYPGIADVLRRGEIRLSRPQIDDVDTLRSQPPRLLGGRQRCGWTDALDPADDLHLAPTRSFL